MIARLWRRYVLLNPAYLTLLVAQVFGYRFSTQGLEPQEQLLG